MRLFKLCPECKEFGEHEHFSKKAVKIVVKHKNTWKHCKKCRTFQDFKDSEVCPVCGKTDEENNERDN